ncbi:MAG: tRNA lysidine(34) synthetase TilS [Rhodospirillaceae bacterium]|nr:tRNA lysidine(34) synthetase TilS [Rhodospirillaceae bacterium]
MDPIGDAEFSSWMDRLGPFERLPVVAVACSGGADSLALTILADAWARSRGGQAIALTVDHGLRADSAAEAETVGRWLAAREIPHHVLRWEGAKPGTGIQAAARRARYALLEDWCRQEGLLHLLLAHHRDDQAETLLMHLARGSGVDGLAGMAPITETRALRLLRPMLDAPHARLEATLAARGLVWVEDPSNRNPLFRRVRMRGLLSSAGILAGEGLDSRRLAKTAQGLSRARGSLETAGARLLAVCADLHPAGFVRLDPVSFARAEPEIRLRALAALCRCLGGAVYPPRLERLERLERALTDGLAARRTFQGCVLAPWEGGVLIQREVRAMAAPVAIPPGGSARWDGRFTARIGGGCGPMRLGALGIEAWRQVRRDGAARGGIPGSVCPTLPALFDDSGLVAIPHLGFCRPGMEGAADAEILFTPERALGPVRHCLV